MAFLAAQLVAENGQGAIEKSVLWQKMPREFLAQTDDNERYLKQIFMALDSVFERYPVQSAAVYALAQRNLPILFQLVQQGLPLEEALPLDDEHIARYLAARSAHTAWLNVCDDVEKWLEWGDLNGEYNRRAGAQMSLPICQESGQVLGILYIELAQGEKIQAELFSAWLGLALALSPILNKMNDELNLAPNDEGAL